MYEEASKNDCEIEMLRMAKQIEESEDKNDIENNEPQSVSSEKRFQQHLFCLINSKYILSFLNQWLTLFICLF